MDKKLVEIIKQNSHPMEVEPTYLDPMLPLGRPKPTKAILFDIYGTLFISASGDIDHPKQEQDRDRKIAELLKRFKVDKTVAAVSDAFYRAVLRQHDQVLGSGIDYPEVQYDEIWTQVLGIDDPDTVRQFALHHEMIVNPVYPMPHLKEVLWALKETGVKMGIVSNAQFFSPLLFSAFLETEPVAIGFDSSLMFYSYRCNYAKPSAYMFRQARNELSRIGIEPKDVLYIGNDMLKDIYPAHNIGFRGVLFAGDKRSLRLRESDPRCRNLYPYAIITDLKQLLGMI